MFGGGGNIFIGGGSGGNSAMAVTVSLVVQVRLIDKCVGITDVMIVDGNFNENNDGGGSGHEGGCSGHDGGGSGHNGGG